MYIVYIYHTVMIRSIRHKRLLEFYLTGRLKGIQAHHATRLRILLTALDAAKEINDLNVPAWNLHALKGNLKGHWSLTVNGNWRITFMFIDEDVYLVDYQDYH
jgi:toxin HigB-1